MGVCGIVSGVRHHHNGCALGIEAGEQFHNLASVLGVKVSRRLVGKDEARPSHHGTGDGHSLLLSAAELLRIVLGAVAHVHTSQDILHPLAALGLGHVQILQLQVYVLLHGEFVNEVEALEHKANASLAQTGALPFP